MSEKIKVEVEELWPGWFFLMALVGVVVAATIRLGQLVAVLREILEKMP